MRLGFDVTLISRWSDELEVLELPELTTGDTSVVGFRRVLDCGCEVKSISEFERLTEIDDIPSLCPLLANGLGPTLAPMPESLYE